MDVLAEADGFAIIAGRVQNQRKTGTVYCKGGDIFICDTLLPCGNHEIEKERKSNSNVIRIAYSAKSSQ